MITITTTATRYSAKQKQELLITNSNYSCWKRGREAFEVGSQQKLVQSLTETKPHESMRQCWRMITLIFVTVTILHVYTEKP